MSTPGDVDPTAARVALWRAMHVQVDPAPHVLEDEIGLKLLAPDASWRSRPDMNPQWTRGYRASIVGRARFIEDSVLAQARQELGQYVLLGAGLDSFAQRHPETAPKLRVFEIDQPGTVQWKRERLEKLGFGVPAHLHLVPVDFESGESWFAKLEAAGFDAGRPAFVASTGVSMYLTREAILAMLRQVAAFAPGSRIAMTFMLPAELVPDDERQQYLMVQDRARDSGTPFLSFFTPSEALALGREAGFSRLEHVSGEEITRRYFSGRADGLRPSSGEEFLVATV